MAKTLKVSFFSYKGGAGITSLLYNTLPFLAKKLEATPQNPIVVIDLDIDSKGLSYLLDDKTQKSNDDVVNAIDVLKGSSKLSLNYETNNPLEHPFLKSLIPIGEKVGLDREENRAVLFCTAHSTNYLNDNNNFDASNVNLSTFRKICENCGCKAIVMDTPAGGQLSGTVALKESRVIVTTLRITKQFKDGTAEFLKNAGSRFHYKNFIVVPNAVPDAEGTDFSMSNIMSNICSTFKNCNVSENENILNLSFVENGENGINEVKLLKFEETNLFKKGKETGVLLQDEESAVKKYQKLADEIVKGF